MTIRVPMGTVVCRLTDGGDKAFVADINDVEQTLVAKGGMGGAGNARFVSAVQQEPVLAEKGEEGEGVTLLP